jgi:hypothetical protein
VVSLISSASISLFPSSTLLLLLGCLAARRLAGDRLLPVLLATAQQLQVTSPASQCLLGHGLQTGRVLLVDGVGADEDGLLGLDDFVAGLDALRTTRRLCQYSGFVVSGGRIVVVRFGRDLLLGLGLLELCLRHFWLIDSPRFFDRSGLDGWVCVCVCLVVVSESGWAGVDSRLNGRAKREAAAPGPKI